MKWRTKIMAMFLVVWVITATGQTVYAEAADGPYASNPDPADGELIDGAIYMENIYTTLDFTAGDGAVKHEGFFSDDPVRVEARDPNVSLGQPPHPSFPTRYYVGLPYIGPYIVSLVRGVTYYWCVDETDAMDNTYPGDIWEFTVRDYKASFPNPPDGTTFIETDVLLSWEPGYGAIEHDVYLGTSYEAVRDARYDFNEPAEPNGSLYVGPDEYYVTRMEPNVMVTGLPYLTQHYWRVDEVHDRMPPPFGGGIYYFGPVCCFTTVPEGLGRIRMDLWWNLRCPGIICLLDDIDYPDNPDETRFLTSFDSGENLGENYGGQIHGWLHPRKSGDYTFWIASDDDSELFLSRDESPLNMERIAYVRLWTAPYEWYDNGEPDQVSAPISLVAGLKYYIMARWTEYQGGDHCMVAWQGPDQPLAPVSGSDSAIIPGSRLSPFVQYWSHGPDPRDGETDVALPVNLSWEPGDNAFEHNIYLGTNFNDVNKAVYDPGYPPPTVFLATTTEPNILVTGLAFNTRYYWRVDEIPFPIPPSWPSSPYYYKGNVWSFTTGLPVGETYHVDGVNGDNTNDGLTPETAFKTIQRGINMAEDFDTVLVWPDVYNEEVSFWGDAIAVKSAADAAIVETDYGYAFSFFSAEGHDTVLSNFVIKNSQYGIYLINGSSPTLRNLTIVNNDFGISAFNGADPDISSCIFWNNYYGDLFRDPVPLEAKYSWVQDEANEPNIPAAGLISHWKFDDGSGSTATDSAGTNNGILIGDPTWTAGHIGGALSFDGDGDYVEFASVATLEGDNLTTLAWVRVDESAGIWNPVIMQHDLNGNGYSFYIANNRPSFYIVNDADFVQVISTEAINADQWYHVAGTNDGTSLKLYVDCQLKDSKTSTGFTGVNYNAYIGFEPTSMLYYKGLIDDVRIYNRALSAMEIEVIYKAGTSGGEPGFVDATGGDYHLLSERGRYWPAHDVWVLDDATSPCIDGGDPAVDPANERMPNGGRINMGAYGNTAYASMSECWSKSDFNCDGSVDFKDFAIMAADWLDKADWIE